MEGLQNEKDIDIWDKTRYNYNDKKTSNIMYRYYKNIDRVI